MPKHYSNRIKDEEAGVRPLSTVLRTLELIDFFAAQTRPQKLSEVSQATGLSPATAYQRLFTLISAGWLEQDDVGRYRLSMLATRLAAAALEQADIGMRSEPALARLVSRVGETASLSVIDRGLPCIVARVESDSLLRADQKLGTLMRLNDSASGRVLAAFADAATLHRLREGDHPLPSDDVLEEAREKGFAVSTGYTNSGVLAVAAPVYDLHGRCRAAVSLVVPEMRFNLDRFVDPLLEAASEITGILNGSETE
ncbi:IclR family transcriptional regulator [Psychromarinibacter sp. C21-152]|uniref:IclR family transcriptional regulator n=1 Tax=Psychromarinibacter sediminicola TaxID=3033385 RepID=A0AAE3NQ55_9RHOB|nr:IclR family transcriptional regulator [Psychromarinibacter sediminicola]MDF0602118.1 IclR family transcriptional regulator [Psychromarinibacter sediminicola]